MRPLLTRNLLGLERRHTPTTLTLLSPSLATPLVAWRSQLRFEEVSAPFEERLVGGLLARFQDLVLFALCVCDSVSGGVAYTSNLAANETVVTHTTNIVLAALSPAAPPGFLFLIAVMLALVHYAFTRIATKRIVRLHEACDECGDESVTKIKKVN